MKSGKASGPDGIDNEQILLAKNELEAPLLSLFNKIINSGILPGEWCESVIVPLHKNSKDPLLPTSYRPINLLCSPLKQHDY